MGEKEWGGEVSLETRPLVEALKPLLRWFPSPELLHCLVVFMVATSICSGLMMGSRETQLSIDSDSVSSTPGPCRLEEFIVTDETGMVLGGKQAAIQFYYDRLASSVGGETGFD